MSLDDYEIIKQIGSGTYSVVFQVRCKLTGNFFAMKEIKFDRLSSKEKEYTKTEVKILKEIHHPNLIRYEKSFTENQNFYIIMELATDGDLQKKIQFFEESGKVFSTESIFKFTYQIILGLSALHSNKILHRDIKASNILLMQNEVVKIGDFNIGKEIDETTLCTKIGTPVMMSPEIWNGEPYNFKTDIWSLGCLVFQMAALKPPFLADSYAALYLKISKSKVPNLANYPKSLNSLIQKLLKKKPKQRPSCEEILKFEEFRRFEERKGENFKVPKILKGQGFDTCHGRLSCRKHHKSDLSHIMITKTNKKTISEQFKDTYSPGPYIRAKSNNSPAPDKINMNKKISDNSKIFKDFSSKLLKSEVSKVRISHKKKNVSPSQLESPYLVYPDFAPVNKRLKSNPQIKKSSHLISECSIILTSGIKHPLKSPTPSASPKPLQRVASMIRVASPF
jgi:NIMA (never in mitosis gene a)-related kinase